MGNSLRIVKSCNGRRLQHPCKQVLLYETCTLVLHILVQCKQQTLRQSWIPSKHGSIQVFCQDLDFPETRCACPNCHLVQAGWGSSKSRAALIWGDELTGWGWPQYRQCPQGLGRSPTDPSRFRVAAVTGLVDGLRQEEVTGQVQGPSRWTAGRGWS